jgi:hypothetical protein
LLLALKADKASNWLKKVDTLPQLEGLKYKVFLKFGVGWGRFLAFLKF